jgi:hypothetical protein
VDRTPGWAIVGERVGDDRKLFATASLCGEWEVSGVVRLPPGKTLRFEITLAPDGRQHEETVTGDTRRARMYFSDAVRPGAYELRATFRQTPPPEVRRLGRPRPGWNPTSLTSPTVRIELE